MRAAGWRLPGERWALARARLARGPLARPRGLPLAAVALLLAVSVLGACNVALGRVTRLDRRTFDTASGAQMNLTADSFNGSLGAGDQRFRTSNGSLDLRLPPAQGFSITAHTSNGAVKKAPRALRRCCSLRQHDAS